ncbi:MAG: peptidyl-prolyl cis-trans isomerase [Planctomycetes bacterium]|nr:peptidyl-prolyl cis-trans isomerase [Planctomycetota bacterium]
MADQTTIHIDTDKGRITAELRGDLTPRTVENFLRYVDEGYYDGLIFHRVIDGFMIQGGGMDETMASKPTHEPIANEAADGLPNRTGTLAMARTPDPDSATSQFFINLVDNDFLNFRDPSPQGIGYCAFGEVADGLDVVKAIGSVRTGRKGHYDDVPIEPVRIRSIRRA